MHSLRIRNNKFTEINNVILITLVNTRYVIRTSLKEYDHIKNNSRDIITFQSMTHNSHTYLS